MFGLRRFSTTAVANGKYKQSISNTTNSIVTKMKVYEKLPAKRNGQCLMDYIREAEYRKLDKSGAKRKLLDGKDRLRADDIITVIYRDQKPVKGQVLAVKRSGISSNVLIRNKIDNIGIDMNIPVFHPNINRIDIVRRPHKYRPRSKHYYIKESRLDVQEV